MAELREITSGLLYAEGPVVMDDGSVIVTESTHDESKR